MDEPIYNLGNDCTLYKLNELILKNCARFDCGADDLNDFSQTILLPMKEISWVRHTVGLTIQTIEKSLP